MGIRCKIETKNWTQQSYMTSIFITKGEEQEAIKIEKIIKNIIEQNKELFGENAKYEKINVGFTNTIYCK